MVGGVAVGGAMVGGAMAGGAAVGGAPGWGLVAGDDVETLDRAVRRGRSMARGGPERKDSVAVLSSAEFRSQTSMS